MPPISIGPNGPWPVIIGAVALGGAAIAAGGVMAAFAAGGFIAFAANFGASMLLSAAAQALAPAPSLPQVELRPRTVTVREPVKPRDWVYGRARKGGVIVFLHSSGKVHARCAQARARSRCDVPVIAPNASPDFGDCASHASPRGSHQSFARAASVQAGCQRRTEHDDARKTRPGKEPGTCRERNTTMRQLTKCAARLPGRWCHCPIDRHQADVLDPPPGRLRMFSPHSQGDLWATMAASEAAHRDAGPNGAWEA